MAQTGWLKQQKFISSQLWKSQIKGPVRLVPGGILLPGFPPSLCVLTWGGGGKEALCRLFLLVRAPILVDQGTTLMTTFNLNYLYKRLPPKTIALGVGLQHQNLGET